MIINLRHTSPALFFALQESSPGNRDKRIWFQNHLSSHLEKNEELSKLCCQPLGKCSRDYLKDDQAERILAYFNPAVCHQDGFPNRRNTKFLHMKPLVLSLDLANAVFGTCFQNLEKK